MIVGRDVILSYELCFMIGFIFWVREEKKKYKIIYRFVIMVFLVFDIFLFMV